MDTKENVGASVCQGGLFARMEGMNAKKGQEQNVEIIAFQMNTIKNTASKTVQVSVFQVQKSVAMMGQSSH